MPQMNLRDARLADPILTGIARGFGNIDNQFVADVLFPRVTVGVRAGRLIVFGKEHFMSVDTARAPGAKTGRVQFGYASEPFALIDHSLEGMVPVELQEESAAVEPGFDQAAMAIGGVRKLMELSREREGAVLARNAALYGANTVTLAGVDQWSDPASTPFADVAAAREAVRALIGSTPNVMIIGPAVLNALQMHPGILERLMPTTTEIPSLAVLQAMFQIPRIIVGSAIQSTEAGVFSDVWGKDVVLAYVNSAGIRDMGSPSYGYTYQLAGYPFVEPAYKGRNEKTWYYPYTDARRPYLVGPSAGYLIKNAVA